MDIIFGIILIVISLFLIVSVLLQNGKSHNLSGAIAGGAETFFGKTKGSTIDKKLSKITTVVAIVFVLAVLVAYLSQGSRNSGKREQGGLEVLTDAVETVADTPAETVAETEAQA